MNTTNQTEKELPSSYRQQLVERVVQNKEVIENLSDDILKLNPKDKDEVNQIRKKVHDVVNRVLLDNHKNPV